MSPTKRIAVTRGTRTVRPPGAHTGDASRAAKSTPTERGSPRRSQDAPGPLAPPMPAPPAASSRCVVPRWVQLVLLPLAIARRRARSLRAAGPVAAAVHRRRADRAAAQPVRDAAAARALPARAGGGDRAASCCVLRRRRASACCSPTRSPTRSRRSATSVPGDRRRRQRRRSPTCRTGSTDNGIDVAGHASRARPRSRRSATASRRARASSSRSPATRCRRLVEASIALILIIVLSRLHAALRRADRRGGARASCRRGDGTPEDDFPTRDPGRGVRLRARPAAVLADHGHERGRRRCGSSARSGSSPRARRTRSRSAPSTASRS